MQKPDQLFTCVIRRLFALNDRSMVLAYGPLHGTTTGIQADKYVRTLKHLHGSWTCSEASMASCTVLLALSKKDKVCVLSALIMLYQYSPRPLSCCKQCKTRRGTLLVACMTELVRSHMREGRSLKICRSSGPDIVCLLVLASSSAHHCFCLCAFLWLLCAVRMMCHVAVVYQEVKRQLSSCNGSC